jgi:hypothetical protein
MTRQLLYCKDIQRITGKSDKSCYRLIKKIRNQIGKESGIPLTIEEFCAYTRIRVEVVRQILR